MAYSNNSITSLVHGTRKQQLPGGLRIKTGRLIERKPTAYRYITALHSEDWCFSEGRPSFDKQGAAGVWMLNQQVSRGD